MTNTNTVNFGIPCPNCGRPIEYMDLDPGVNKIQCEHCHALIGVTVTVEVWDRSADNEG